jgi:hypothetical protein
MTGATKQRATKRIRSIEIVIVGNYIFVISILGQRKRKIAPISPVINDDTSHFWLSFSF